MTCHPVCKTETWLVTLFLFVCLFLTTCQLINTFGKSTHREKQSALIYKPRERQSRKIPPWFLFVCVLGRKQVTRITDTSWQTEKQNNKQRLARSSLMDRKINRRKNQSLAFRQGEWAGERPRKPEWESSIYQHCGVTPISHSPVFGQMDHPRHTSECARVSVWQRQCQRVFRSLFIMYSVI